jgi:Fur family ferric uptake transcriptional regulator
MILEAIEESDGHISAEEIHQRVGTRFPQVNISTVYRTLELFKELGLVTETDLGEGRVQYHLVKKGRHHHLICEQCGAVMEMKESLLSPLRRSLQKEYGFRASLRHFAIFGRCARCQG